MTISDATDTALIADLRVRLLRAGAELEEAHRLSSDAVAIADRLAESLARAIADRDAHAARAVELAGRVTEIEVLVEQLRCGDLSAFMDDELDPVRTAAFREHLERCGECKRDQADNLRVDEMFRRCADPRQPRKG